MSTKKPNIRTLQASLKKLKTMQKEIDTIGKNIEAFIDLNKEGVLVVQQNMRIRDRKEGAND